MSRVVQWKKAIRDLNASNAVFFNFKDYPGQAKRHSLSFQVEAAVEYLVVVHYCAHD